MLVIWKWSFPFWHKFRVILIYSQIRLMVHRIMVQSAYLFKSGPERNGGLLSKQLLDNGWIRLLVQFLLDKTAEPLSILDCIWSAVPLWTITLFFLFFLRFYDFHGRRRDLGDEWVSQSSSQIKADEPSALCNKIISSSESGKEIRAEWLRMGSEGNTLVAFITIQTSSDELALINKLKWIYNVTFDSFSLFLRSSIISTVLD